MIEKFRRKVQTEGWGSLLPAGRRYLRGWFTQAHRRLILRNPLLVRLFPFRQPPILLLSYPRSGSSWVGDILAASEGVAYLFEPVTRCYQQRYHGPALADMSDPIVQRAYLAYSRDAFRGMPPREPYHRENLGDFTPFYRRPSRRLLIKEVNPDAAAFYWRRYRPFILFLVRHPAAVALSFWNMGWLSNPDVQRAAARLEGDDWEKFGYAYGITLKNALDFLKDASAPHKILFYEHLAQSPQVAFKKLFRELAVELPAAYDEVIREYCYTGTATQGYRTRRNSAKMIAKWKRELSPDAIAGIRRGYFRSGLAFYRAEADWRLQPEGDAV